MEQPFPKRRRLSPPGSTGASSVTPNMKPMSNGGIVGSGSRPSFISPTKASLARFNPDLLKRPQSGGPKGSARKSPKRSTPLSKTNDTETATNGGKPAHGGSEVLRMNGDAVAHEGKDVTPAQPTGLSAAPRRRSRTPSAQPSVSKPAQTQSAYGTRGSKLAASAKARQTNGNTQTNNVTMEGHKQQGGITIDQSSLDKLPATPTPHGVPPGAGKAESSEPSLPSTPSQLGLEAPLQRPKGLLFGTPSKMAKLAKKQKKVQSAPPRHPEESLQDESSAVDHPTTLKLGPKLFLTNLPKPPPTPEQAELRTKTIGCKDLERDVLSIGSNVLKDTLFSHWEDPAAKESTAVQRQQKKLTDMSERLFRLRQDINDLRSLIDSADDNTAEGLTVGLEKENPKDTALSMLTSLPRKLAQFFPFLTNDAVVQQQSPSEEESYHPVKHIKISNSQLEDDSSDPDLLLQVHNASFMSEHALVEEKIRVKFDSRSLQIAEMNLLPLGEFGANLGIRPVMEEWVGGNVQSKELSSIGRAVNRCSALVKKRDECWKICRERFSDLVRYEALEKQKHRDDEIMFRRKGMALNITWTISLRDDGDTQSELSILTVFPQAWWEEHILSGREVENVRTAFDLLVRERGVAEAVTEIVKLLFPNDY